MQIKTKIRGDLQDGRGVRHGHHLPTHKYIRNTSTCGTTPTQHLLNAGRRPQTSQKARNAPTYLGRAKEKRKKQRQKNRDGTCTSGRELWRRKIFHTLGSPFTGGDGVGKGEASEPHRRAQQQGHRGQSGEIPAQRIGANQHSPARETSLLIRWDGWELVAEAPALEVRSQGEDWGWLCEHSLKGASVPQLAGRESGKKSGTV